MKNDELKPFNVSRFNTPLKGSTREDLYSAELLYPAIFRGVKDGSINNIINEIGAYRSKVSSIIKEESNQQAKSDMQLVELTFGFAEDALEVLSKIFT